MTVADIDRLIDNACRLFRRAVAANAPENDRALDLYVESRRAIREAVTRLLLEGRR